jgi:hypothetical protein
MGLYGFHVLVDIPDYHPIGVVYRREQFNTQGSRLIGHHQPGMSFANFEQFIAPAGSRLKCRDARDFAQSST